MWAGHMPACCDGDGGSRPAAPWSALVTEGSSRLHIRHTPSSPSAARVPVYEGPDATNRQLGWLEPGQPARALDESDDGQWVRVHLPAARELQEEELAAAGQDTCCSANARPLPEPEPEPEPEQTGEEPEPELGGLGRREEGVGLSGWVHARAVPQSVVSRRDSHAPSLAIAPPS
eukprot:COSAG04_NODE_4349_length_2144_cov_1.490954_2_plen_175_part_00